MLSHELPSQIGRQLIANIIVDKEARLSSRLGFGYGGGHLAGAVGSVPSLTMNRGCSYV